jgi:20S proteasome alpha/beta subunit
MTYIVAALTEDSIVLSSDGRSRRKHNHELLTDSAIKVFHIRNGVFWGAAASGIYEGEMETITNFMQLHLPLNPPYNIAYVAQLFAGGLQHIFKDKPEDFWLDFIFTGYSRDNYGNALKPRIYSGRSGNGYTMSTSKKMAVGQVDNEDIPALEKISDNTDQAVKDMRKIINKAAKRADTVGGDIRTVIIKDMGKKKFKELIKKASQPVQKEQDLKRSDL